MNDKRKEPITIVGEVSVQEMENIEKMFRDNFTSVLSPSSPLYLLYEGMGGWSASDTAYLIDKDGNVSILENGVKDEVLPAEVLESRSNIEFDIREAVRNFSNKQVVLGKEMLSKIEEAPQRCCGMDGFEVSLFKIEGNNLTKVWRSEDYGQLLVLNEVRDKFRPILSQIRAEKLQTLVPLSYEECVQLIDKVRTVDNALWEYKKCISGSGKES